MEPRKQERNKLARVIHESADERLSWFLGGA